MRAAPDFLSTASTHSESFEQARETHQFEIAAIVVLPNHLHAVWTLPPSDSGFFGRDGVVSRRLCQALAEHEWRSAVRKARNERGIWQRRVLGTLIRDDADYARSRVLLHQSRKAPGWCGAFGIGRTRRFTAMCSAASSPSIGPAKSNRQASSANEMSSTPRIIVGRASGENSIGCFRSRRSKSAEIAALIELIALESDHELQAQPAVLRTDWQIALRHPPYGLPRLRSEIELTSKFGE